MSETECFWSPRLFLLKGLCTDLPDTFPVSSSAGGAAQKVPGTYREELNCLSSEKDLGGDSFIPDRSDGRDHDFFAEPFPTQLAGIHHI